MRKHDRAPTAHAHAAPSDLSTAFILVAAALWTGAMIWLMAH